MKKKKEKYVDYVIQDCPILGKKIVRHYLESNKKPRT